MSVPLILLPGLAASREVFEPQRRRFPNLIIPEWPKPDRGETLSQFAKRFAASLAPVGTCVLGGLSFGGMLVQEMARFLQPQGLILIATIRGPDELPLYAKAGRSLRGLIPWLPVGCLQQLTWVMECPGVRSVLPFRRILARQFRQADQDRFRWSLDQIVRWPAAPVVTCPTWHIHGDRDPVLPASRTSPDRLVPGGGHALTLTHPQAVNDYIAECLSQIEATA
jgi:pimeloyl-ACP methyl ester carboxylesterase